jgi:hypothetical protein
MLIPMFGVFSFGHWAGLDFEKEIKKIAPEGVDLIVDFGEWPDGNFFFPESSRRV